MEDGGICVLPGLWSMNRSIIDSGRAIMYNVGLDQIKANGVCAGEAHTHTHTTHRHQEILTHTTHTHTHTHWVLTCDMEVMSFKTHGWVWLIQPIEKYVSVKHIMGSRIAWTAYMTTWEAYGDQEYKQLTEKSAWGGRQESYDRLKEDGGDRREKRV